MFSKRGQVALKFSSASSGSQAECAAPARSICAAGSITGGTAEINEKQNKILQFLLHGSVTRKRKAVDGHCTKHRNANRVIDKCSLFLAG